MYYINKYTYVDTKKKFKFEVYSRTVEFADNLVEKVNKLGMFNSRKKKIRFCIPMVTEDPPYQIELEQYEAIQTWQNNKQNQ